MAFGHANIMRAITVDDDQTRDNLAMVFAVPDLPPAEVVGFVEVLLRRHESLRTKYRLGPVVTQHVAGSGEQAIEVVEADGDPSDTAERTAKRLRARPFDFQEAPPLRVAFVTQDGLVRHLVWVVSHLAMDVAACEILLREWSALTAGRELPPNGPQPLDVVEFERKPFVRRLTRASARYWESRMRQVPQAMFPVPAAATSAKTDWRHPGLRIRSQVAMTHLAAVAERTGASPSTVLLAAVNALVCHYTGLSTCVTTSLYGNRVFQELGDLFGTISQDALLSVPVPETGTFDELVRVLRAESLTAYRAAWYDPAEAWDVITRVTAERGASYARDLVFNDMSPLTGTGGEAERSALKRLPWVWIPGGPEFAADAPELDASLEWLPAENVPIRFIVYVYRLDEELDVTFLADPLCLDRDGLTEFCRGLLRLLRAAAERDQPLKEVAALTALEPMARGDGWHLADSCWIEVDAVRGLLADVLGDRPHHVAAVPDEALGRRLVCYLTGPADPEDVHRRCVERLPGRVTAITPHEYVVCASPPDDPADTAAWTARPVVSRSSGRGGPR
ncbi:condensation domain-containing protein [Actinosynnema sp. CS-041913]|uniref:condensation domain-containing protein n=1 Tax=Actinosynnema sp. CS-041913 TaxID=3239917 RepID=UPI003D8F5074